MIQFLIQFSDPICLSTPLRRNATTNWIGKLDRKLDRLFRKIGSLEPMIQFLRLLAKHVTGSQLTSQLARPIGQAASQPATSRPPVPPWLAGRLAGQMADGLVAGWPQSCPWLTTGPACWAAGWPACYGWLAGIVAGPTALAGVLWSICSLAGLCRDPGPTSLCMSSLPLIPCPQSCDMDFG